MSTYINTTTGEYPRHIGDILLAHPDADPSGQSLPEGWAHVAYTPPPSPDTYDPQTQIAVQLPPLKTEQGYQMQWTVRDMTPHELYVTSEQHTQDLQAGQDSRLNNSGSQPDVIG